MVGVRIEAFAFALADRELSPFDADLIFDQTLGRYDGDLGDEDLAESSSVRSGEHLKELSVFLRVSTEPLDQHELVFAIFAEVCEFQAANGVRIGDVEFAQEELFAAAVVSAGDGEIVAVEGDALDLSVSVEVSVGFPIGPERRAPAFEELSEPGLAREGEIRHRFPCLFAGCAGGDGVARLVRIGERDASAEADPNPPSRGERAPGDFCFEVEAAPGGRFDGLG